LREAVQRLRARDTPTLALFIDLACLPGRSELRPEALLRELIDQAGGLLRGFWRTPEQVVAEIVSQLSTLASSRTVYFFCDTTEAVQDDRAFWDWLEEHLAGPLAVEGYVRQVYAGRVRAPWRRIEVRRTLRTYRLEPLPQQEEPRPVQALTIEVFNQTKTPECQLAPDQAASLAEDFACGHPLLAQDIARYLGAQPCADLEVPELKKKVATEVIKPFIEQVFFRGIPGEWREILAWAGVLDWFDATILRAYLGQIGLEIPLDWEAFFISGMAVLVRQYALVEWDNSTGAYRLAGTVRDIIRRQMEIAEIEQYRHALEAAAQAFEQVANEFFREEDVAKERQRLVSEASKYRQRLKEVP